MNKVAILEFCENAKGPTWLMWVCVSEKSNLKEKKEKNTMPNYVWWIYTQNYVFKITYQIPSNVKMGYIYIFNYRIEIHKEKRKWKVNTSLFRTK